VLQERDQENSHTIQQQKRKIARLQVTAPPPPARHAAEVTLAGTVPPTR
jgi:hypothetical protein